MIVQGVYELFEKERSTEWGNDARLSRLVFIGTSHMFFRMVTIILSLACRLQLGQRCAIRFLPDMSYMIFNQVLFLSYDTQIN